MIREPAFHYEKYRSIRTSERMSTLASCFILEPNKHYSGIGGSPTGVGPDLEWGEERAKHSKD